MANKREPVLQTISIMSLRPTQMTVRMREVKEKRKRWRAHKSRKRAELLGRRMIPVVLGPDKNHYVIDHHHMARALHEEGEEVVLVSVVADLTMVDKNAFWVVLDNHRWVYPYDAKGERRDYRDLPKTVADLKDDPFRSLAGELRRVGGFAKDTTPFSEFLWADFLRRKLSRKDVENNFSKAIERALALGKSKDAVICQAGADLPRRIELRPIRWDGLRGPLAGASFMQPPNYSKFRSTFCSELSTFVPLGLHPLSIDPDIGILA